MSFAPAPTSNGPEIQTNPTVATDTGAERLVGRVEVAVEERRRRGRKHRVPRREAGWADAAAIRRAHVVMKSAADVEAVVGVRPARTVRQPAGIADCRREARLRGAIDVQEVARVWPARSNRW